VLLPLILWLAVSATPALAAAGSLDTSFNGTGKVQDSTMTGMGIDTQSTGRIIVAGSSFDSAHSDFVVARYTGAGALDLTFGGGDGYATVDFGSEFDYCNAVVVDPLDRIILVGGTAASITAVARLNPNGSPDGTFSGDGRLTIDLGGTGQALESVAVTPTDKIIASGEVAKSGFFTSMAVVRVTTAGVLDATFAGDGLRTVAKGTGNTFGSAIASAAKGKMVVAGLTVNGSDSNAIVARFTKTGALDATFSGDGLASPNLASLSGGFDIARGITIQSGNIVIVGTAAGPFGDDMLVARFTTDGKLDKTFSGDGRMYVDATGGSGSDSGRDVTIQTDGKIVAVGSSVVASTDDFLVVRLKTNGGLDNGFSGDGRTTTPFGTLSDVARGVVLQLNGRILVVGTVQTTPSELGLARYLAS
jgi:hypothetical protein